MVQEEAKGYGVGHRYVQEALAAASSPQARAAMGKLLGEPKGSSRGNAGSTSYDTRFGSATYEDVFGFQRSYEDFIKDTFGKYSKDGQQQRTAGGRQAAPPPRTEQPRPQESPELVEARTIVAKITGVDRRFSWLANEDPMNVLRVIKTVRQLRTQAESKGEPLSDRQVYLRYRRQLETGSNPRLELSFRIVDALMGGKPSGKLPF